MTYRGNWRWWEEQGSGTPKSKIRQTHLDHPLHSGRDLGRMLKGVLTEKFEHRGNGTGCGSSK